MVQIPNGFPNRAMTRDDRIKVEQILIGQQYVVDGIGFELNWVEFTPIAAGQSAYAIVNVPVGYYLALDERIINPSADRAIYRVYPQGSYTLGAIKPDDGNDLIRIRNLRQDAIFNPGNAYRTNVSVVPDNAYSIVYEPQWGSLSSGNRASGDVGDSQAFLLLSPGQQFLLEMQNASSSNSLSFQVKLYFALIPEAGISPPIV